MKKDDLSVIGLGYVGLPLAIKLTNFFNVIGFDINHQKIQNLKKGIDNNLELKRNELKRKNILFTNDTKKITKSKIFIICVPTPIFSNYKPNLNPIITATELVAQYLKEGDLVIYESTVFPGCTENICNPILEKISGLKMNRDFFLGYSPERVNPGDRIRSLDKISKVISASSKTGLNKVHNIYSKIIKAQIYKAQSIQVAEASKVIENVQRSVNISLINEISIILKKMNINTKDVLDAAKTKWNFADYRPGLVGGHCIAVDPYYLAYKAKQLGINPKLILAGQKINETMPKLISRKILKVLKTNKKKINKILVLGVTFKENCPDLRDSKVINIIQDLSIKKNKIFIYDPWTNQISLKKILKTKFIFMNKFNFKIKFDIIIIAVSHNIFKKIGIKKISSVLKKNGYIYDVKSLFHKKYSDESL